MAEAQVVSFDQARRDAAGKPKLPVVPTLPKPPHFDDMIYGGVVIREYVKRYTGKHLEWMKDQKEELTQLFKEALANWGHLTRYGQDIEVEAIAIAEGYLRTNKVPAWFSILMRESLGGTNSA